MIDRASDLVVRSQDGGTARVVLHQFDTENQMGNETMIYRGAIDFTQLMVFIRDGRERALQYIRTRVPPRRGHYIYDVRAHARKRAFS